jgi:hypothetical protein
MIIRKLRMRMKMTLLIPTSGICWVECWSTDDIVWAHYSPMPVPPVLHHGWSCLFAANNVLSVRAAGHSVLDGFFHMFPVVQFCVVPEVLVLLPLHLIFRLPGIC